MRDWRKQTLCGVSTPTTKCPQCNTRQGFDDTGDLCPECYEEDEIIPLERELKDRHTRWLRACAGESALKHIWTCSCGFKGNMFELHDNHLMANPTHEQVPTRILTNGKQLWADPSNATGRRLRGARVTAPLGKVEEL